MKKIDEDKTEEYSEPIQKSYQQKSNPQKFQKNWEEFSLKEDMPNFIKNQAYFNEEKGKKEMIIKLDSIQEQSAMLEDNPATKREKSKNNNKMDELND